MILLLRMCLDNLKSSQNYLTSQIFLSLSNVRCTNRLNIFLMFCRCENCFKMSYIPPFIGLSALVKVYPIIIQEDTLFVKFA